MSPCRVEPAGPAVVTLGAAPRTAAGGALWEAATETAPSATGRIAADTTTVNRVRLRGQDMGTPNEGCEKNRPLHHSAHGRGAHGDNSLAFAAPPARPRHRHGGARRLACGS